MTTGIIMAMDIGDVRTGIAVTDALQIIASPLRTVPMKAKAKEDAAALAAVVEEIGPAAIVAGYPLNQAGEPGPQAKKVEAVVEALKARISVPVHLLDERFTTAEAHKHLHRAGVSSRKQRASVDQVAAVLILETWLQRERNRGAQG